MWTVWAWAVWGVWWAGEAVVWGAGLGLGLVVVGAGGWALGSHWAEPSRDAAARRTCGRELGRLVEALWWSAPGRRRLVALHRLADWAKRDARRRARATAAWPAGSGAWHGVLDNDFPKDLVWVLVECLEESPSEAAPLFRSALFAGHHRPEYYSYPPTDDWCIGWKRFFSEDHQARFRSLLLASEDPAVTKALLRLMTSACVGLPDFQCKEAWATSSAAWAVEGRASLARHQAFLRDPAVLTKLRGLLSGGDPHRLLYASTVTYKGLVCGLPTGLPFLPNAYAGWPTINSYGPLYLLRPILEDLAGNFDKIGLSLGPDLPPELPRFYLFPLDRPEEAEQTVEGFLLPWLARAEELSPDCLRWLSLAFPSGSRIFQFFYNTFSVPITPALQPWLCPLGLRLRGRIVAALGDVLRQGRLSPAQAWGFLAGACDSGNELQEKAELFRSLHQAWGTLPIPPESSGAAELVSKSFLRGDTGKAETGLAVRSGGFLALERLLAVPRRPDTYHYCLASALRYAQRLLSCPDFVLSGGEVAERLLLWRDSGLRDALRDLLAQDGPPATASLRTAAQGLLNLSARLLHHQPPTQHSHLPHDIRFPLH